MSETLAERDELGMAMLAAWLNVRVDQIPPENRAHLNPYTMEAWRRVGEAAQAFTDHPTAEDYRNRAERAEQESQELREQIARLRPMAEAPKDRTPILARLGANDSPTLAHLTGRSFVVFHEGTTSSGYDLGWALFPGHGGIPDEWLDGWLPLPTALEDRDG